MSKKKEHKKYDPWGGFTPKQSYRFGHEDEGISSVLEKPISFRYSDKFLKQWYTGGLDNEEK